MKKEFATYEISLELKGLGFDEPCLGFWNDYKRLDFSIFVDKNKNLLKAPLWSQVIDWLREKHDIHIDNGWCVSDPFCNSQSEYGINGYDKVKDEYFVRDFSVDYYIAREMSVLKSIEYIKTLEIIEFIKNT